MTDVWGRLDAKVDRSAGELACWPWTGTRTRTGGFAYGQIKRGGRMVLTHRLALESRLGRPVAVGMLALHSCDNPPCCNPAHLYEGTASQNLRDSWQRGVRATTGRPTLCRNGLHHFDAGTTRIRPNGRRQCIPCANAYQRARYVPAMQAGAELVQLANKQLRMLEEDGGKAS